MIFSEFSPGTPPLKYNFPARNRIISGLARSVVVIQAPEHSGALITADYALDQGRDLYVHKTGLVGRVGAGTRSLALTCAQVIAGVDAILEEWGIEGGSSRYAHDVIPSWDKPGVRIVRQLELELGEKTDFSRRYND